MLLPEGYKLINNRPIPEAHRSRYNHSSLMIEECEKHGQKNKADTWRDHRHSIMMMAVMATADDMVEA